MSQDSAGDWASYWRSPDEPVEAMRARFRSHVYHRHSHETYSFGVTEAGAQAFTCRGARHVSSAGRVMAFNSDDPHDGWAADSGGFTYLMIHIGPALMADMLAGMAGRAAPPLFTSPVLDDAGLGTGLRRLYAALTGPAGPLEQAEQLCRVVAMASRHTAGRRVVPATLTARDSAAAAQRVRAFLEENYPASVTGGDVATAAGASRYAAYRSFRARYGLSPSEYQRGLRLRAARRALARGAGVAEVAAQTGFADQAHLTRWFRRWYGITPGAYRAAVHPGR